MMLPTEPRRVFLAIGIADMRKSINGLSVLVQQAMALNPFEGDLFVFCNRRRDTIKILYWDHNGFCIWQKRLEEQKFPWPRTDQEVISIGRQELEWLLSGLDYTRAHRQLRYSAAG